MTVNRSDFQRRFKAEPDSGDRFIGMDVDDGSGDPFITDLAGMAGGLAPLIAVDTELSSRFAPAVFTVDSYLPAGVTPSTATSAQTLAAYNSARDAAFAVGGTVKFTPGRASGTITIVDYSAFDGAETFSVNGVVLTHTTDFAVATSNAVTALNLANAINAKVPGVKATVAAGVITVTALDAGLAGNAITLVTTATAEEATVSGATLTGGSENRPYAIAVEPAAGAAENRFVVWL